MVWRRGAQAGRGEFKVGYRVTVAARDGREGVFLLSASPLSAILLQLPCARPYSGTSIKGRAAEGQGRLQLSSSQVAWRMVAQAGCGGDVGMQHRTCWWLLCFPQPSLGPSLPTSTPFPHMRTAVRHSLSFTPILPCFPTRTSAPHPAVHTFPHMLCAAVHHSERRADAEHYSTGASPLSTPRCPHLSHTCCAQLYIIWNSELPPHILPCSLIHTSAPNPASHTFTTPALRSCTSFGTAN